jgi:hypothetical protein
MLGPERMVPASQTRIVRGQRSSETHFVPEGQHDRSQASLDAPVSNVPREIIVLNRLLKECASQDAVALKVLRDRLEFTLEFFTLSIKDVDDILDDLPY